MIFLMTPMPSFQRTEVGGGGLIPEPLTYLLVFLIDKLWYNWSGCFNGVIL